MFGLGAGELVAIFGIGILFFGGKKIPELAKALGQSVNQFKTGMNEAPPAAEKSEEKKQA